jgi:dienelactone hydrolase
MNLSSVRVVGNALTILRIAVVGHSFGGQLTLLTAERDSTLGAAVTFGAAAASWESSSELRDRMLAAVRSTTVPIMFIHAANDYSTAPGHALAEELAKAGKPYVLKIYPPFGKTADEGHNFVYTDVVEWEADLFGFLDALSSDDHAWSMSAIEIYCQPSCTPIGLGGSRQGSTLE